MPRAKITMLNGDDKGRSYEVTDRSFSFGRVDENDIVVEGPTISRKHAKIAYRHGEYVLTDLGAKNRTRVNGEKVTECNLSSGDEIRIGGVRMQFDMVSGAGRSAPAAEEESDDGTQLVDMDMILQGAGPNTALVEKEDGGTEVVPIEELLDSPQPPPDWRGGKKKRSKRKRTAAVREEPADGTELLDMGKLLDPNQVDLEQMDQVELGVEPLESDQERVSLRDASDLGGTDLLNMDDVLGKAGPGFGQLRPVHYLMAGGGILFAVIFISTIVNTFFSTKTDISEKEYLVGQNRILEINTDESNPLQGVPIVADQDVLVVRRIMVSRSVEGYKFYFLVVPLLPDTTTFRLEYKNGNRWYFRCKVEDPRRSRIDQPQEEKEKEVRRLIEDGKLKFKDRSTNLDNLRAAFGSFEQSLAILRTIPFGQFLTEFQEAKTSGEKVADAIDKEFRNRDSQLSVARSQKDEEEIKRLLGELCQLRRSDHDQNYLILKTELELLRRGAIFKRFKE